MNRHEGHDVIEMPLNHLQAIHLYCLDCRVTSPGKVRDMTPREVWETDPMVMSASPFD